MAQNGFSEHEGRGSMLQLSSSVSESLLQSALSAVVKSGHKIHPIQTAKLPFLLQIQSGSELSDIRIYLWELIYHSKNRYEVQVEAIDRFKLLRSGKTLVLGWWKRVGVFVGFDVRRHSGKLGSSPSIRIREDVLRKAYVNGFEPYDKGNGDVAIAFRPDFFGEYVRNLEPLHDFGQSRKDLALLSEVAESPQVNESNIQIQNADRKAVAVSVSSKLRDIIFRTSVLSDYGFRCAFCGTFEHVDAAHIVPVNHKNSTDEIRNGLALCTRHREAYDSGLITVGEDYSVQVNRARIRQLQSQRVSDKLSEFSQGLRSVIILPPAVSHRPHAEYIRIANNIRGWK